ncbi:MAG: hypothetical protein WC679_13755 [Bacteroidales bacterium]|jgi:hypothetical protein
MNINGKEIKEGEVWKCPKCEAVILFKEGRGFPALSRRDNKTEICTECGQEEAFSDYLSR